MNNTERQAKRRTALSIGLTHVRLWATKDNIAAIIDAKELGEQLIAGQMAGKDNE